MTGGSVSRQIENDGAARGDGAALFDGRGSRVTTAGPVLETGRGHSYPVSAWAWPDTPAAASKFVTVVSQSAGDLPAFFLQYRATPNRWVFAGPSTGHRRTSRSSEAPASHACTAIRTRTSSPAASGMSTGYRVAVACSYDLDVDDGTALLVGSPDHGVVLWNRVSEYDQVVQVCVRITSRSGTEDMTAAVHGVELAIAGETLSNFLGELAEGFAGWRGERTWRSLYGDVEIAARHSSWGHVRLSWTVRPRDMADTWRASIAVDLEAGEEMRRLAADAYRMLRP